MNKWVYLGKIVNTHGIKGELRLLSQFEKKMEVFTPNFPLYIGQEKQKEVIKHYRPHKEFDMITLIGYTNINEVLKYKGEKVYINREDLRLEPFEYLYEELVGLSVYEQEEKIGTVKNIVYNKLNILLQIASTKDFYIPLHKEFIKKVDVLKNRIDVIGSKGLRL